MNLVTRTIWRLGCLALLVTACEKTQPEAPLPGILPGGTLELSLGGAVLQATRTTGVPYADESAIHYWAYWIFDQDGRALQCRMGADLQARIILLSGRYTVVVVANFPQSGSWALPILPTGTLDDLLDRVTDLSCNTPSHLIMAGCETVEMVPEQTARLCVELRRLVSKVSVRKVSVAFTNPILAARETRLRAIYLTNVCRRTPYGGDFRAGELSAAPAGWYNAKGWHGSGTADAACDALLGDLALNRPLTPSSPLAEEHAFYPFPNPSSPAQDSHAPSWCVRSTRLVLEVSVGAGIYYYPIRLPAMVRNHPYVAEEVILRDLGSLDPEEEVPGALEVHFSTQTESGWDNTYTIEEIS